MLLDKLINRYWFFKQISPLVDLNLYVYHILYEVIRPRILRAPTDEEFIKNHYIEGEHFILYNCEGVKFTSKSVNYLDDCMFDKVMGFSISFQLHISYDESWSEVFYRIDFYNSLIDKTKICIDNKVLKYGLYSSDEFNIL